MLQSRQYQKPEDGDHDPTRNSIHATRGSPKSTSKSKDTSTRNFFSGRRDQWTSAYDRSRSISFFRRRKGAGGRSTRGNTEKRRRLAQGCGRTADTLPALFWWTGIVCARCRRSPKNHLPLLWRDRHREIDNPKKVPLKPSLPGRAQIFWRSILKVVRTHFAACGGEVAWTTIFRQRWICLRHDKFFFGDKFFWLPT